MASNNSLAVQLPLTPPSKDSATYNDFMIVYNAIRQLQYGVDQFLDIPPNVVTAPYTWAITDRGHSIDTTADITIPLDANPSTFNPGATTLITNLGTGPINIIASVGVSLVKAGTTITGNRVLSQYGMATIRYIANNVWLITGAGIS